MPLAQDLPAAATGSALPTEPLRHHDLDHLAGAWSREEHDEFMQAGRGAWVYDAGVTRASPSRCERESARFGARDALVKLLSMTPDAAFTGDRSPS